MPEGIGERGSARRQPGSGVALTPRSPPCAPPSRGAGRAWSGSRRGSSRSRSCWRRTGRRRGRRWSRSGCRSRRSARHARRWRRVSHPMPARRATGALWLFSVSSRLRGEPARRCAPRAAPQAMAKERAALAQLKESTAAAEAAALRRAAEAEARITAEVTVRPRAAASNTAFCYSAERRSRLTAQPGSMRPVSPPAGGPNPCSSGPRLGEAIRAPSPRGDGGATRGLCRGPPAASLRASLAPGGPRP